MSAAMDARVQTTLRLPNQLYRELKVILDQHLVEFDSLNDLAVAALDQFIRRLREQQIDALAAARHMHHFGGRVCAQRLGSSPSNGRKGPGQCNAVMCSRRY